MNHIMLDLETMGTRPDAAIVAIGAAAFDIEARQIGALFYRTVDLTSAVKCGGVMDPDTVLWWLKQNEAARRELYRDNRVELCAALAGFSDWVRTLDGGEVRVWGNGAAFDNVVLRSAYDRLTLPVPWKFWNDRCYRTIKAQHPDVPLTHVGTHHNAVDDAESQARHLIAMLSGEANEP